MGKYVKMEYTAEKTFAEKQIDPTSLSRRADLLQVREEVGH